MCASHLALAPYVVHLWINCIPCRMVGKRLEAEGTKNTGKGTMNIFYSARKKKSARESKVDKNQALKRKTIAMFSK